MPSIKAHPIALEEAQRLLEQGSEEDRAAIGRLLADLSDLGKYERPVFPFTFHAVSDTIEIARHPQYENDPNSFAAVTSFIARKVQQPHPDLVLTMVRKGVQQPDLATLYSLALNRLQTGNYLL